MPVHFSEENRPKAVYLSIGPSNHMLLKSQSAMFLAIPFTTDKCKRLIISAAGNQPLINGALALRPPDSDPSLD